MTSTALHRVDSAPALAATSGGVRGCVSATSVVVEVADGLVRVRLVGAVDAWTARILTERVAPLCDAGRGATRGGGAVLLDLSALHGVHACDVTALLACRAALKRQGWRVRVTPAFARPARFAGSRCLAGT